MGNRAVMLAEQVTLQSGGSFAHRCFSAERREIIQSGDIYLFGYLLGCNHQDSLNGAGCRIRRAQSCVRCTPLRPPTNTHAAICLYLRQRVRRSRGAQTASGPPCQRAHLYQPVLSAAPYHRDAMLACGNHRGCSRRTVKPSRADGSLSPDPSSVAISVHRVAAAAPRASARLACNGMRR